MFFSAPERGRGNPERQGGRGGSAFSSKSQEGGGVSPRRGWEGARRVSAGNLGEWGGAKYFFSGPKCPPRLVTLVPILSQHLLIVGPPPLWQVFIAPSFMHPSIFGVCPLVLQKLVLCVLLLHGWQLSGVIRANRFARFARIG